MKIVRPGRVAPALPPDWWAGHSMICRACGAVFVLDADDAVVTTAERRLGGLQTASIACPTCGNRVTQTQQGYTFVSS